MNESLKIAAEPEAARRRGQVLCSSSRLLNEAMQSVVSSDSRVTHALASVEQSSRRLCCLGLLMLGSQSWLPGMLLCVRSLARLASAAADA